MKIKYHLAFVTMLLVVWLATGCSNDEPVPATCTLKSTTRVEGSFNLTESYTYNDEAKVISIIGTSSSPSPLTYTHTFTYGSNGNLATADYGNGLTATFTLDSQNRVVLRTLMPGGMNSTYIYSASGQLIQRVYTDPTCSSCGYTRTYNYPDSTTHNYTQMQYVGTGGEVFTITYEYDNHPNPEKAIVFYGGTTNNITKETYTDSVRTFVTTYTYTYNNKGYPVTSVSDQGSSKTYTYTCK